MEGAQRRQPGAAGFTLVEVLISVVIMAIVGVAIAAISLTGVVQISDDSQERQLDATAAQWTSMVFAKDVQGASAVVDGCAGGPDGERIVTLEESDGSGTVEYRTSASLPYSVIRYECGGEHRVVVEGLDERPECVGGCPKGKPRKITLKVSRTSTFEFELDGVRRTSDDAGGPVDPSEAPSFLSLGGDPLDIGGSATLTVNGNAYINKPDSGAIAIKINGNGIKLTVTGEFRMQEGADCPNCKEPKRQSKPEPGVPYPTSIPDPLRFLERPTASVPGTCAPAGGGVMRCTPGYYDDVFSPGGAEILLEPGVYVLRRGLRIESGVVKSEPGGVLLYNAAGLIKLTGGNIDLDAPTSGKYSGLVLISDGTEGIELGGNSTVASFSGTIYAPRSSGVILGGSAASSLSIGRVIGTSLSLGGGATVTVNGS